MKKENLQNYKVLLVEDDEDDYFFFNLMLSSLPPVFQMLRIQNGIMLSSIIQTSHVPDVIFLDLNMPYKSGFDCLKEIRGNSKFDSVKVVIYSTSSLDTDIKHCYNLGADFYITKPVTTAEGKEQLSSLFDNQYFYTEGKTPIEEFIIGAAGARGFMARRLLTA